MFFLFWEVGGYVPELAALPASILKRVQNDVGKLPQLNRIMFYEITGFASKPKGIEMVRCCIQI